ncbi:hypothetical protein D9758_009605 [Tetrapyrgos nigripes]|uniref:Uncharacterized protein n=1 Tax=Tetrapyrgos nigripes TaxID=182062 RepID=A0A8H5LML1_9AGAR|nr:hypothetical protein D9758_009605 [Tetrapyrgos nigripes]
MDLAPLRIALYFALSIFSIVVLGLAAARLHYTLNLPLGDPLNFGVSFHDPIVVELLVTSILTMLWSWHVIHVIHKRRETRFVSTFRGGFVVLFILWVMWLVGAAIATHASNPPQTNLRWGDLSSCWGFKACRILTAFLAFVWISWIVATIIFIIEILFVSQNNGALRGPYHGRWDPRRSEYGNEAGTTNMSQPRNTHMGFTW